MTLQHVLQALYQHGGYDILDIRTPTQVDRFGKVPACARAQEGGYSICVPYKTSRRWFEDGKMQEEEEPNEDFLYDVEDQFDKDAKIMVMDFDGQTAIEALELLDDNGFTNIVGVQGGFKKWFKAWDTKLKRRNLGEYQEHSWGEGECSTGIHASGAGFANQDAQSGDFWKSW
jgi:rhodanese-related sulfurtransferase